MFSIDYTYSSAEKRVAYAIDALNGICVFRFIVQLESEAVTAAEPEFQPDILFQFHSKQASAAEYGTEDTTAVAFGYGYFL